MSRQKVGKVPKLGRLRGSMNGGFGPDPGECMDAEDLRPTISGHLVFLRGKKGEC